MVTLDLRTFRPKGMTSAAEAPQADLTPATEAPPQVQANEVEVGDSFFVAGEVRENGIHIVPVPPPQEPTIGLITQTRDERILELENLLAPRYDAVRDTKPPTKEVELVLPIPLALTNAQAVNQEVNGKPLPIYELTFVARIRAEDVAYVFDKVRGHAVLATFKAPEVV